jgi:hypothetical protein
MNYFKYLQDLVLLGSSVTTAVASILLFCRWRSLPTVLLLSGSLLGLLTVLVGAARHLLRNLLVTSGFSERTVDSGMVYAANWLFVVGMASFSLGLLLYALRERERT